MLNTKNTFKPFRKKSEAVISDTHCKFSNEKGRSMIEMLGTLAIIGVLSTAGIEGYSKAMIKFKINKTKDQIAMLVTNIRTLFAQQNNYSGLNPTSAIALNIVDNAMIKSNAMISPFGPVDIDTGAAGTMLGAADNATAFIITLSGVPRDACISISTGSWGSAYSSGFLGIAVGDAESTKSAVNTCKLNEGTSSGGLACFNDKRSAGASIIDVSTASNYCQNSGTEISIKYY